MRAKINISLVFSLFPLFLMGQSLYNNASPLYIGNNTILFVADSIINDGTIINNGDIQVGGVWQNNDTYEPGQGQLTLTSSQTQIINHNNQSFTRLTISGGGTKIFGADITIEDELIMDNGILQSNGNAKIIINADAVISGGSAVSFIEGPLYHIGIGNKYFPVGINNVFLPVELLDIQGTTPTIGILVNAPNPNLEVDASLAAVTDQQYWELDVINGTYDNSIIKLPINEELFLETIQEAVVVQSPGLDTPFSSIGGANITGDVMDGSVTSETLATQAFFTIGKGSAETIPNINVYNAISPNGDGVNDFLKIENIELYPNNFITVYTRWGDKVFEQAGYNNIEHVFEGKSNLGKNRKLLEGTYYYVVEKGDDSKNESGFIVIRY